MSDLGASFSLSHSLTRLSSGVEKTCSYPSKEIQRAKRSAEWVACLRRSLSKQQCHKGGAGGVPIGGSPDITSAVLTLKLGRWVGCEEATASPSRY